MRQLDRFDSDEQAQAFGDVLLAVGIHSSVKPSPDGGLWVWVHDEHRLNEARALLDRFRENPADPQLAGAAERAERRRKMEAEQARRARQRIIDGRRVVAATGSRIGIGPVTLGLILASVAVALLTTTSEGILKLTIGDKLEAVSWFSFQSYVREGDFVKWSPGFSDLWRGQVWRIFTPMLIHFGLLHIVFNMWWLRDLGTQIERHSSSVLLGVMVLVISGVSNTAQYLFTGSPFFGGMSGVVYGLFGYIWIRRRYDPGCGLVMPGQTVIWMIGFYVLCWTGAVGPVANVAHTGGLVVGALWGALAAGLHRKLLRRR